MIYLKKIDSAKHPLFVRVSDLLLPCLWILLGFIGLFSFVNPWAKNFVDISKDLFFGKEGIMATLAYANIFNVIFLSFAFIIAIPVLVLLIATYFVSKIRKFTNLHFLQWIEDLLQKILNKFAGFVTFISNLVLVPLAHLYKGFSKRILIPFILAIFLSIPFFLFPKFFYQFPGFDPGLLLVSFFLLISGILGLKVKSVEKFNDFLLKRFF